MKKLFFSSVMLMVLFMVSSCKKQQCKTYYPNGQLKAEWSANNCDMPAQNATNYPCNTCGGGGGGGGVDDYVIFDINAYTPSGTTISTAGWIANNPLDAYGEDFENRKRSKSSYDCTPDMDRDTYVDGDGTFGVDRNKMIVWVLTIDYGYIETVIDMDLVNNLYVESAVTVEISFDPTLPFAVAKNPDQARYNVPMRTYSFTNAYYAKVGN